MSSIVRAISPEVPEPQPGTWSNCLVVGGVAYLAGMRTYRAGPERRRHYRLLLLDAPPATPLRTTQYLDAAIALSLAPVQSRQIKPMDERRPSSEVHSNQGYRVFLATGLRRRDAIREQEEQDLVTQGFPLSEVERMVRDGEIEDATTVAALGPLRLKGLI